MNFIDTIKGFFKAPKGDPAARDTFSTASDNYEAAFNAIEPYTNRANNRFAILQATRALNKALLGDPDAGKAYDEAVASYTDPADFEPYTDVYLDAHDTFMDTLTAAFDDINTAFAAFNSADALYASAASLYKAICGTYTLAAVAYSNGAHCAMMTALEGNLQSAKDDFQVMLLKMRADNLAEPNPLEAKAKAASFKSKATEDATKAKVLEQTAKVAETKAKAFLAKAKSVEAKA
jgi:hypothetical protein